MVVVVVVVVVLVVLLFLVFVPRHFVVTLVFLATTAARDILTLNSPLPPPRHATLVWGSPVECVDD